MEYRVTRGEEDLGAFSYDDLRSGFSDGTLRLNDAVLDPATDRWMELSVLLAFKPGATGAGSLQTVGDSPVSKGEAIDVPDERAEVIIKRLARYERISAVVWLGIAIVQIIFIVTALAGLWNLYAVYTRFKMAKAIERRNPGVPAAYEGGVTWIIVMAVINLSVGGVFAAGWCGFDWYVRSKVLKYREVFAS